MTHTLKHTLPDEALARLLALGDEDSFALLVQRYEGRLRNYVLRNCYSCSQEMDDLLQEIFLRTYLHIHDYDSGLSFSAWIYRIAHNLMVSSIRKHQSSRHTQSFDENLIPSHRFRADGAITRHQLSQALHLIQIQMPAKLQDVFVLRFLEEKDYSEIGDILCENINTISTRVKRARDFFIKHALELGLEIELED